MRDANLSGANLSEAEASGADFRGAATDGANMAGLDVNSARIDKPTAKYRVRLGQECGAGD